MKDKEKQIEEIKQIIDNICEAELGQVHASSKDGKVTKTVDTSLIAKNIYEHLTESIIINTPTIQTYSTHDNDLVVLSRKEYESDLTAQYDVGYEFGSKETAEKFYKKVRKLLKKVDIIVDGDEGLVGYEESAVDKGLTEIAKSLGVEIKE